jgi:hypothetical protein
LDSALQRGRCDWVVAELMFMHRVLRRIDEHKREELTEGSRMLYNSWLNHLKTSVVNIIIIIIIIIINVQREAEKKNTRIYV